MFCSTHCSLTPTIAYKPAYMWKFRRRRLSYGRRVNVPKGNCCCDAACEKYQKWFLNSSRILSRILQIFWFLEWTKENVVIFYAFWPEFIRSQDLFMYRKEICGNIYPSSIRREMRSPQLFPNWDLCKHESEVYGAEEIVINCHLGLRSKNTIK